MENQKTVKFKGKSQVNSWSEAMDFITIKLEEYEREQQEKYKIIGSIKSEMVNMNKQIEKLERIVDRQEQYSRRNCLLLYGIAECERENTGDLVLETLYERNCLLT